MVQADRAQLSSSQNTSVYSACATYNEYPLGFADTSGVFPDQRGLTLASSSFCSRCGVSTMELMSDSSLTVSPIVMPRRQCCCSVRDCAPMRLRASSREAFSFFTCAQALVRVKPYANVLRTAWSCVTHLKTA